MQSKLGECLTLRRLFVSFFLVRLLFFWNAKVAFQFSNFPRNSNVLFTMTKGGPSMSAKSHKKSDPKKRRKKRVETFNSYIYKVR